MNVLKFIEGKISLCGEKDHWMNYFQKLLKINKQS